MFYITMDIGFSERHRESLYLSQQQTQQCDKMSHHLPFKTKCPRAGAELRRGSHCLIDWTELTVRSRREIKSHLQAKPSRTMATVEKGENCANVWGCVKSLLPPHSVVARGQCWCVLMAAQQCVHVYSGVACLPPAFYCPQWQSVVLPALWVAAVPGIIYLKIYLKCSLAYFVFSKSHHTPFLLALWFLLAWLCPPAPGSTALWISLLYHFSVLSYSVLHPAGSDNPVPFVTGYRDSIVLLLALSQDTGLPLPLELVDKANSIIVLSYV